MYSGQVAHGISQINIKTSLHITPEHKLDDVLAASVLEGLNEELNQLAEQMKNQFNQKQGLKADINFIQSILGQQTILDPNQEISISAETQSKLLSMGFSQTDFTKTSEGTSIKASTLNKMIETKAESLTNLNSNTELTNLSIQSLISQRKEAISLLSNMMASENDVIMAIARNIKN